MISGPKAIPWGLWMLPRKALIAIVVAIALVPTLGYALFLRPALWSPMPLLLATVELQADIPEGAFVTGIFVAHCGDRANPDGTIDALGPIPPGATAALYLRAVGRPEGVGVVGTEPALLYFFGETLTVESRLIPPKDLFAVRMEAGDFIVPPGVRLEPGATADFSIAYEWTEGTWTFTVTELFHFEHGGPAHIRAPFRPGVCA